MSNAKHTPGPWRVSLSDDTVVIDAHGREVAMIDGDYNRPDEWPIMEANTRLIAAAPDLLATLERLLHLDDSYGPFGGEIYQDRIDRAWEKARAALAKAKGAA